MAGLKPIPIDDDNCFACGLHNPVGLKLKFRIVENSGSAACDVTIPHHFNGWKGAAHGGIITTLLDETMVYACTSTGWFTVTGTITVKFHKPVPTGVKVRVTGEVVENRGRSIKTTGSIVLENETLATAEAMLIPVKQEANPLDAISKRLIK